MRDLNVGLTAEQLAKRRFSIGGSDANILMSGDPAKILGLWQKKTGKAEADDLSKILAVQMGSWTEELNRYWFEMMTGREVTSEGNEILDGYRSCTLDGETTTEAGDFAVFEAKHVNMMSKMDEVVQRYMPQLHHNSALAGVRHAVLSVFIGTMKWEFYEVEIEDWYLAELHQREEEFWAHVQSDTPPVDMPEIAAPIPVDEMRTVDMTGNNAWASSAADWLESRLAAKKFEKSTKTIKEMIDGDVRRGYGHGIDASRNKRGAIAIKECDDGRAS